jgi:hypothetical protein
MRVLYFDAKIEVQLEDDSSMTADEIAENVANEICVEADIPQASWVVDYAIQDVTLKFAEEGTPVPDDADEGGE